MELIFKTSQVNFEPIKCLVFGSSALEIPTEFPTKTVLTPIAKKLNEKSTTTKVRKDNDIKAITITSPEHYDHVALAADEFEEELESNVSQFCNLANISKIVLIRKSELYRFVSIGKEPPEYLLPELTVSSVAGAVGSSSMFLASEYRVEVDYSTLIQNHGEPIVDRSGNRLLQRFLTAVYTVIYRIRADKRIARLKEIASGVSNSKSAYFFDSEESLSIAFILKPTLSRKSNFHNAEVGNMTDYHNKIGQEAPVLELPKPPPLYLKPAPNQAPPPPLPDMLKPRPIDFKIPTYAEKQGLTRLNQPPYDMIFDVKVPTIKYESKKKKLKTAKSMRRGDEEPEIPEISVTTCPRTNLYVG